MPISRSWSYEVGTSALVTEQVDATARALAARWRGGDPADAALRRACSGSLAELRGRVSAEPAAFSAATVRLLKDLSSALTATQVQARLDAAGAASQRPAGPSPHDVLRDVFGYESFRAGQQEIIDAVLAGRDCVGIMPTGAGKSLTYQIPARILGGLTLVVSPLIALMKDQVDAMTEVGLRATYLSASLPPEERQRRIRAPGGRRVRAVLRGARGAGGVASGARCPGWTCA